MLTLSAGTVLVAGVAVPASSVVTRLRVDLDAFRVRAGGEVAVAVEGLPPTIDRVPVHLVTLDDARRPAALLGSLTAQRRGERVVATFRASNPGQGLESQLVAAVVVCEDGQKVQSDPVMVICSPQLPGI